MHSQIKFNLMSHTVCDLEGDKWPKVHFDIKVDKRSLFFLV